MSNDKTDPSGEAFEPSPGTQPSAAPVPVSKTLERDRYSNLQAIEVVLVNEMRRPPAVDKPWTMAEIWTQNRVYHVDVDMKCIEVVDIGTHKPILDHGLLGARLLGGQHDEENMTHLSHPFPRPGTDAVFEQRLKKDVMLSHSSTVTRVVLRLRQLSIVTGGEKLTWDEIAGQGRKTSIPGQ